MHRLSVQVVGMADSGITRV